MMMNLMTILVKKVFISSKPTFVYLLCPPLCGPFSIQESAAGGLSYKVKNGCRVVSPAATVLIIIDLHNSAPMQESAYGPDKTHNSYTGRLSYGSPAVHDTARSEAVKAMQVPAGRVQSPSQKAGWGTSDLPAALR